MKKSVFVGVLLALMSLAANADTKDKTNPTADRYNVTDATGKLAFGKSYYELDGKPSGANGNFYSASNSAWSIKSWPDKNQKKHIATYLHFPKCKSNARIQLTTTGTVGLTLVVTSMETGREIGRQEISIPKGTQQWVDVLPETSFSAAGWYKFDLTCTKGVNYVGEFFYWQFDKSGSTEKIFTADYMSSPSVHLGSWKTTHPDATSTSRYDWCYQEVMVPESSAVVGTYCMSLGVLRGYMGIQIDSDTSYPIIFSMWDNGSTDKDPNLPEYLRSGALDWEKGVTIARFANEGTGAQAKYRTGRNWLPGKWVKFITNARPEVVNVEIDDPNNPGQKKTITYTNTLCSAWYMAEGIDTDWHYIATLRESGANNYFDGWYSFLENYNWPTGQWQRKAYYRNGGLHSVANGQWYHANSVTFGHTDGGSLYGDRRDYGQGQTEDYEDCFFMTTGGYHEDAVQNSKVVALHRDFMPVDQATLDRLTARVDQAIRKEQMEAMKESIDKACVTYPQNYFQVTAKSDEATNEGSSNVATAVLDGNESTYWHTKWSGGETPYPHYLTIKVNEPEKVSISQITFVFPRESRYRAKQVEVSKSSDGKTFTKVETLNIADGERSTVQLANPVSAAYVKLTFKNGQTGGNLLCLGEIYFKGAPSVEDLKKQAANHLAMADQFGGYSSEDLAELKAVYDEGRVQDFAALSAALNKLALEANPLKFGRVDEVKNLSSFKAYQIHGLDRQGDLAATADGNVIYTGTDGTSTNVVSPYSNWLLLHSNTTGKDYAYNLGAKKFLVQGTPYKLSDDITPITLTYSMGGFRLGTSATWEVRDNYAACPSYEEAASVLASIDREATASVREAKYAQAKAFLDAAQKDAALEYDACYAGCYDTSALEEVLAKDAANVDAVVAAYDQTVASAMPQPGKYYRLANYARPTTNVRNNYLGLSGTKGSWKFKATTTTTFGVGSTESSLAENFRLYAVEKEANDSTLFIYSPAANAYFMTQNADGGCSALAKACQIQYQGKRLFRMKQGGSYLTLGTDNTLKTVTGRDDAGMFYFEEVKELPSAISTEATGLNGVCLPVAVALPEGVKAFIPVSINATEMVLEPLNDYLSSEDADLLPARVPVIIYNEMGGAIEAQDCAIVARNVDARLARAVNLLQGTTYKSSITRNDYVMDADSYMFVKAGSTSLVANSTYISAKYIPEDCAGSLNMKMAGEVLGVHHSTLECENRLSASGTFDLMGRPARYGARGVLVKDGKKIVR